MSCEHCAHCAGLRIPPEVSDILAVVARHFRVTVTHIRAKTRRWQVMRARLAAYYLLREVLDLSTPEIGYFCGRRDHSTVISGLATVRRRPMLAAEIEKLKAEIGAAVRVAA